jgi:hypothetical protein
MSTKILGEPIHTYHAHDAVSSTRLNVFHNSPLAYFEQYVTKTTPPVDKWEFDFGQAFHALVEGEEAFQRYVVPMKFDDFRTNAARAWRDEMKVANKLILTAEEIVKLTKMKARVQTHPIAAQLIADTEAEVTWRRSYGKFTIQCRTDRWGGSPREIVLPNKSTLQLPCWFVDFKTTASIPQFRKKWIDLGYARQKVFYTETILACQSLDAPKEDIPRADTFWIVSESEPPHECRVFNLGPSSCDVARAEVMTDLKMLRHAYETGAWEITPEIETLEYPRWQVEQAERRLLEQRERLQLNA